MNYCDTFHWQCLLDPFYALGMLIWLMCMMALLCAAVFIVALPFMWVWANLGRVLSEKRRADHVAVSSRPPPRAVIATGAGEG